jgi:integrase
MLQNMTKDEIMIRYLEISKALNDYKNIAMEEYSEYERSRQAHFTFNRADGSHPEAINHWLAEMQEHISVRRTERQTVEFARKILTRASADLKTFFKTITLEEKLFFMQSLIKTEAKLLKIDEQRAQEYFGTDPIPLHSQQFHSDTMEAVMRKILDEKLGAGKAIVEIDKADAIQQYKETPQISKRYKREAYMFNHSFALLMSISDKRYLNDYTEDDYELFMETFVWTPAWQGGRKSFYATVFNADDIMLAKYFKKFYIENLDEDEDDLPFKIDKDYPYDESIFNNEEVLAEFEKLDVQSTTTLQNKYSIVKKFFEWCVADKNYVEKSPFSSDNNYKWSELIKEVGNAIQARNPFSNEELIKMFRIFIENNFFKDQNLAYFYVPMISLFSGMRIEEVCKLRVADIIKENGIYCFDINGQVKTVDSIRKVPIHKFLLKNLRLLEYVASREALLFDLPVSKINGKIKYSKKYSAIFGEFRKDFVSPERIGKDLISFHSFRHYFATSLHTTAQKTESVSALLGHRMTNNETNRYLKKDIEYLNKELSTYSLKNFQTELDLITVKFSAVKFKK